MAVQQGSGRSRARAVTKVVLPLIALGFIILAAAPLLVRGRILAHLVEHLSKDLCGSVTLEGGHFSAGTIPALIFQRPFDVALDGISIREPEGEEFFRARTVRLEVTVLRRPWRVVIDRALVADGAWRMASKKLGQQATVALRSIPAGGRAQCRAPAPPGPQPRQGPLLILHEATLRNLDVVLSFPSWAVVLDSVNAHGSVEVRGAAESTQFLFDVRDVRTVSGGSLRVGPAGVALTPEVPFDQVSIPRVAVTANAPQDLRLEVEAARTGAAVLAGKAVFTNVFAPDSWNVESGMELEARWRAIGEALARNPAWASVGDLLAMLQTRLHTSLHGTFDALTGSAVLDGKGIALRARLLPHRRYKVDAAFDHFDIEPLLPAAQRNQFGGSLDGHISVSAVIGLRAKDLVASLDTVELALSRGAGAAATKRMVVTRGPPAASRGELRVNLGVVAWQGEGLSIDPLRVQGPGLTMTSRVRAERERGSDTFRLSIWTEPGASVSVAGETFVPPPFIGARFDPGRQLAIDPFSIQHVGGGAIRLGGSMRFGRSGAPNDLHATISDYPLAHIPGIAHLPAPGQGQLSIGQVLGGRVEASFNVQGSTSRPSVTGVLSLANVRWASWPLGGGRVVFSGTKGGTRFDGQLLDRMLVRGEMHARARPKDFVALSLHDFPLSPWLPRVVSALALHAAGDVAWRPGVGSRPPTTSGELAVRGSGVDVNASVEAQPARRTAVVRARVTLAQMRQAFPALRLRRAEGVITTDVRLTSEGATGSARADGTVVVAEPLQVWAIRLPTAISVPRTTIELRGDEIRILRLNVITEGIRATVTGAIRFDSVERAASVLDVRGHVIVDGQRLGPWLPAGSTGSGAASVDVRLAGTLASPRIHGQASLRGLTLNVPLSPSGSARFDGPVEFDGRTVLVGPLTARFGNGGWIELGGPGGPGRLVLAPRRSPVPLSSADLTLRGEGLGTTRQLAGVTASDLAFGLRLTVPSADTLRVVGAIRLGHVAYHLKQDQQGSKAKAPGRPEQRAGVLDHVWVQLRIYGPENAVTVDVPYAPDVTVGLRCTIEGPLSSPHVSGAVRGDGAYSKLALGVADRFSGRDLSKCDFAPK